MKKALTLLAVTMLTATSVGCNCCPCLRNICPWNLCAPRAYAPAPVATYAAVPATCPPTPVYAAAPATPMYAAPQQYTVPQYAAPQYAMPAQPVYSDAGCGTPTPYACESSCGMSYTVADPGCGYMDVGYGAATEQVMVDPAPAP